MAKLLSTIIDGFISSRKFVSGLLGEGWKIGRSNDRYKLEIDDIVVRNTMTVFELLISKIRAIKGALGITQGSGKVKSVREEAGNYYLEIEDEMSFMVHDIVRCMEFNGGLRSYWVVITEVREHEIGIAKSEFGSMIPQVGDELVQFGNTVYTNRQSAIYLHADENGVPAIDVLQGIDGKTFEDKVKLRVGGLSDITDTDFPEGVKGFGIYSQNGYFKGTIAGAGVYLLRPDGSGYLAGGAISWDKQGNLTFGSNVVLNWENLSTEVQTNLKGEKGEPGDSGMSIMWKGDATSAPSNPQKNWVYRNTNSGVVYIYNGSKWEVMITDGDDGTNGKDGQDGWNVYITYSDSETEPDIPTGNGTLNGWHTNATASVNWMSQKIASQANTGTWGNPIKVRGEKGADGGKGPAGEDANLLPWIQEWDNNKTQIGATTLISPKIFAGTNSGSAESPILTGVAIGRDVITKEGNKTGVFGLNKGEITFSIDAETGKTMYRGELNVNDKCSIDDKGKLIALDALVMGRIEATGGQFGNLKIEGDYLTSIGNSLQLLAGTGGVRFIEINKYLESFKAKECMYIRNDLGTCLSLQSFGGVGACLSLLANSNGQAIDSYGDVRFGLRDGESISIDGGNVKMEGGSTFMGLGLEITTITTTTVLANSDCFVICKNSSEITLYLPSSPAKGMVLWVRKEGSKRVVLNGNGKKLFDSSEASTRNLDETGGLSFLIYDGKRWAYNFQRW